MGFAEINAEPAVCFFTCKVKFTNAVFPRMIARIMLDSREKMPMRHYLLPTSTPTALAVQFIQLARQQNLSLSQLLFVPQGLQISLAENSACSEYELEQLLREHFPNVTCSPLHRQGFEKFISHSPKMLTTLEQAKKFAQLDAPLLIQGETGTGKDLLAKACHEYSHRAGQKFIAVNCAGLPPNEAESEMFGYCSNQGTTKGFFEYAHGGTVLLDGVAELSLDMQAKLLRFLNDGSFRRVGEAQEIQVNVRVICTSQQPLSELVESGKIRQDLYHRLNVLSLTLPPLRERKEDIPALAAYFIEEISRQLAISVPQYEPVLLQQLQHYPWSGNVRELYNALFRACSLAGESLNLRDFQLNSNASSHDLLLSLENSENATLNELVGQLEASLLRKFYAQYPSTRKLAQRLGISHTAVANKLRLYGIRE